MNADKRTVSTDALETLGNIINEHEKRDAIHIAVEPTQAKERLFPGQHVGVDGTTKDPVGIVDPFLKTSVMPGEWFWLLVYPREIKSLRHVWSHPAFDDNVIKKECIERQNSMIWMESVFGKISQYYYDRKDYDHPFESVIDLIEKSKDYIINDIRLSAGGADCDLGDFCDMKEFWHHFSVLTGIKVPEDKNEDNFLNCCC